MWLCALFALQRRSQPQRHNALKQWRQCRVPRPASRHAECAARVLTREPSPPFPPTVIEDLWYKNAVIYALTVETFMDGNGDGCGDFEGLMRRLDYLESLGLDAVWLGPFMASPNRDHGYDISNFYGVDPRFGSSGDFVEFMNHANSRGIRVLIDLVVNLTSDEQPWFKAV